jgi:hypothetical protein
MKFDWNVMGRMNARLSVYTRFENCFPGQMKIGGLITKQESDKGSQQTAKKIGAGHMGLPQKITSSRALA